MIIHPLQQAHWCIKRVTLVTYVHPKPITGFSQLVHWWVLGWVTLVAHAQPNSITGFSQLGHSGRRPISSKFHNGIFSTCALVVG
jgi:hypothetical protein